MPFAKSISSKKLSLVSFDASWCGTCQTMLPILTSAKNEIQNRIQYLEIDTDKNPLIAAAFRVRSVPSILLFKSGEVLWRHAGLIPSKELVEQIKKISVMIEARLRLTRGKLF